ncbi:MAG: hypothetical protein ACXWWF_06210 [Nitrospira sp.]
MGPNELAGVEVQGSESFLRNYFPAGKRHWEQSEFPGALAA